MLPKKWKNVKKVGFGHHRGRRDLLVLHPLIEELS